MDTFAELPHLPAGEPLRPRRIPLHVVQAAVVFDDFRLVYVPVPKAGSTAILWALAGLAGLSSEDFARSRKLEVTRSLAVHDMSIWGSSHQLAGRTSTEIEWILGSDEWFRISVVREPVRRLWSAWVSKVLMRDPRFVTAFGAEEWFPQQPASSTDVIESFRRFVHILPRRPADWHDPHWLSQADLIGTADLEYAHLGRAERLHETVAILRDYVASRGHGLSPVERRNPSLLPFVPGLLDPSALDACNLWVARDREAFGYGLASAAEDGPDGRWHAVVEANLPAIQAIAERNERIADLRHSLRSSQSS